MTKVEMELREALVGTGIVAPVSSVGRGGRLEILCRQVPGVPEVSMIELVAVMLTEAEAGSFGLHVCKRFVLKDGKPAFGWNFAIEMPTLKGVKAAVIILKAKLETFESTAPRHMPTAAAAPQVLPKDRQSLQQRGVVVDSEVDEKLGVSAGVIGNMRPVAGKYEQGRPTEGKLMVTSRHQNEDGNEVIQYSMPLPHVTKSLNELNGPKHDGGAGATKYGKRAFTVGRRVVRQEM